MHRCRGQYSAGHFHEGSIDQCDRALAIGILARRTRKLSAMKVPLHRTGVAASLALSALAYGGPACAAYTDLGQYNTDIRKARDDANILACSSTSSSCAIHTTRRSPARTSRCCGSA